MPVSGAAGYPELADPGQERGRAADVALTGRQADRKPKPPPKLLPQQSEGWRTLSRSRRLAPDAVAFDTADAATRLAVQTTASNRNSMDSNPTGLFAAPRRPRRRFPKTP